MSNKHTAAFPQPMGSETTEGNQGMTLRQYYAGEAMKALLSPYNERNGRENISGIPKEAFCIADAMLTVGDEKPGIEAVETERNDWLTCACEMNAIALKLDRIAEHMSGDAAALVDELLARFRQTDANY
jgi:hypothetical protein